MAIDINDTVKMIEHSAIRELHFDEHCGRSLHKALTTNGFQGFESGDRCTVASFESNLKKGNVIVNIVDSRLFGPFTQVTISRL